MLHINQISPPQTHHSSSLFKLDYKGPCHKLVALKVEDVVRRGHTYKAFLFSALWTNDQVYTPLCYVTI